MSLPSPGEDQLRRYIVVYSDGIRPVRKNLFLDILLISNWLLTLSLILDLVVKNFESHRWLYTNCAYAKVCHAQSGA